MPEQFLNQFFIKIGGSNVPAEFMRDLVEVVVDSSLYLPEMFTIRMRDYQVRWVDDSLLELGQEVEISAQAGEQLGGQTGLLMKGEIAALEPDFSAQGETTMLIRGYNKSHRLHRGKKTRTFLRQSDSDIVKKVADEVGLSPQVDSTSVVYDYVIQNNQTNMEFLQARAERLGYKVFAAQGELHFKKGEAKLGEGPELKIGEALRTFRPVLAATHQADKITVLGWDAKGKEAIKSEVTPPSALKQGGIAKTGGDAAKEAFGAAEAIVVSRPVFTVDEAEALATGLANDLSGEFIQAEGVCFGDPNVKAGHTVTISGVGQRFSGKYFVTTATHIWNDKVGYETHFGISGRQPNTISHLLEPGNGRDQSRGLVRGVVTGLVTNLNDPDNLGRVKVKYDWLGDNVESDWVWIASPMGGAERGFFYLPEINDEVLIAFEHGDIHRPYIVGSLWNSKDKPPKPNSEVVGGGKVNERIIKSRSGHVVIFDDSDGQEKIIIRDKTEKNEIEIDSSQNSMTIKVDGDFTVEAQGKITLKSTQDMTLESQANGKVKTTGNLNVEATGNGTVKGTQLTLEGTAMAALKAPTVSVEGSAMAEIKGGLVKIN